MKTLIIGLGNPILGDDGIGWRVAEKLQPLIQNNNSVEVDSLSLGGISLMERLIGYERVIIIDSICTGQYPVGTVGRLSLDELPNRAFGHTSSAHDTTLQNALTLGKKMGAELPNEIIFVTIEAKNLFEFSEQLSPPVEAAIPEALTLVMDSLSNPSD